jgi:hypothetical protein
MRYLAGTVRRVLAPKDSNGRKTSSDSDWAGLHAITRETRTRAGTVHTDHGMLTAWQSNLIGVVLSPGEGESMAASDSCKIAMNMQYVAEELGDTECGVIKIYVDATVAVAFANKTSGNGRMKHIDIRSDWVRVLRDTGKVLLVKIPGELNPADFMTKILGAAEHQEWCDQHFVYVSGHKKATCEDQGGMEKFVGPQRPHWENSDSAGRGLTGKVNTTVPDRSE